MNMKTLTTAAAASAALVAAMPAGGTAAQAATTRHVEGRVLSVDRSARTFRLRDHQRGTLLIRVTSGTRFERIGGFAGLHAGMSRIESTIVRSGGRWVARVVERSGGGGRHGGGRED